MGLFNREKKQKLLAVQNLVLEEPKNKLILSEQQIFQTAKQIAERNCQILIDCANILGKTLNPDVFFSRHALLLKASDQLKALEPYLITSNKWSETNYEFHKGKQNAIHSFLIKYSESVLVKIVKLKTNKAKKASADYFINSLIPYNDEMNTENILFYNQQYEELLDFIPE